MSDMRYDYLIVGAGFAGAVLAERLASAGKRCLVVDRRNHIAGNAHDRTDASGILLHWYGPHYFRTNSLKVIRYLSRFTEWNPTQYKILSCTHGRLWNFPINLNTFEQWLGRSSTTEEMRQTFEKWRVPISAPKNSEEVMLSKIGKTFYELFFENYTLKQWQRHPRELDASVCARIPVRFDRDDRYLSERFQALPRDGYTAMFERILDSSNITLALNTDYREVEKRVSFKTMIYTGMIDEYFDCCFGHLPYRSLRFDFETYEKEYFQPVMQVNYPNDFEFTRIVEIKHATGQRSARTTIVKEYPEKYTPGREAFYPIPAKDSRESYKQYAAKAEDTPNTIFVGRLAQYRYYNMDQIVSMALNVFERIL